MSSLPDNLPKEAFTLLGAAPVSLDGTLLTEEERFGETCLLERKIRIDATLSPTMAWKTYWHEVMHLVLEDSGAGRLDLDPKHEEALCDALGTYMTAAMKAGFISVKES